MEADFNFFIDQLKEAMLRVDQKYIEISIYKLPDNRYRERVYCYELYHQLRKLLGDTYQYNLDGELVSLRADASFYFFYEIAVCKFWVL